MLVIVYKLPTGLVACGLLPEKQQAICEQDKSIVIVFIVHFFVDLSQIIIKNSIYKKHNKLTIKSLAKHHSLSTPCLQNDAPVHRAYYIIFEITKLCDPYYHFF